MGWLGCGVASSTSMGLKAKDLRAFVVVDSIS